MTVLRRIAEQETGEAIENVLARLDEWSSPVARVGDWRYFVPESVAESWDSLTVEEKLAVYIMAFPHAMDDDPLA